MLAIVADIAWEDLVIVALEKSDVLACLCVPKSADSIKSCAQDEISFRVEFDSCDFTLMALQDIAAAGSVNIVDPNYWISWTCDQFASLPVEI